MGREVVLVDSADATAFSVSDMLREADALRGDSDRGGVHRFESSGDIEAFRALGRQLLGPELDEVAAITWPESSD
jgi:glutamate racemase